MVFCPECGNELKQGHKFCPSCGAESYQGAEPGQKNAETGKSAGAGEEEPGPSAPGGKREGRKAVFLTVGLVSLLAVAAALYFAVIWGDKEDSTAGGAAEEGRPQASGIENIRLLQAGVDYTVLAPTYIPEGFKLVPGSAVITDTGTVTAEHGTSESYSYELVNGEQILKFQGNVDSSPPSGIPNEIDDVGSYRCYAFTSQMEGMSESGFRRVPFEERSSFFVCWQEDRDMTGPEDVEGAYALEAVNVDWDEVVRILESMKPVDEADVDIPLS